MSAIAMPNVLTFIASAAIAKGKAVTLDATGKIVTASNAVTDKSIGIAVNAATVAGDKVEVAIPGGGAKALLGGTVAAGDLLAPTTGGALIATTTATNRYVAIAMEAGVIGDIVSAHIALGLI